MMYMKLKNKPLRTNWTTNCIEYIYNMEIKAVKNQ